MGVLTTAMSALADAIREKAGVSSGMTIAQMTETVEGIQTGSTDNFIIDIKRGEKTTLSESEAAQLPSDVDYGCYGLFVKSNIQSVDMSSVTGVGESTYYNAFSGCTGLTDVSLDSLSSVSERGFYNSFAGCSALSSVTINPDVITDGYDSYLNPMYSMPTGSLVSVTFSKNATKDVGLERFGNLTSGSVLHILQHLGTPESGTATCSFYNTLVFKDDASHTLQNAIDEAVSKGWTINNLVISETGQTTKQIFYKTVDNQPVTPTVSAGIVSNVYDPEDGYCKLTYSSNKQYVSGDFKGCTGITDVMLAPGSHTIYADSFSGCTNLSGFTMPYTVTGIGNNAFAVTTSLREIELSKGLRNFSGQYVFDSGGIETLTIPDSVQSLSGNGEFPGYCRNLEEINIGSGLTALNFDTSYGWIKTFSRCYYRKRLNVASGNTVFSDKGCHGIFSGSTLIAGGSETTIPSGVTRINENCFYAQHLTGNPITSSITYIDDYAFNSSTLSGFVDVSRCNMTGSTFAATKISELKMGRGSSIPGSFARNCHELTAVTAPSAATEIGTAAFSGCENLAVIELPKTIRKIGREAFRGCSSLSGVSLYEGLSAISYGAFTESGIKSLRFPSTFTGTGDNLAGTFSSMRKLERVEFEDGCALTAFKNSFFSLCDKMTYCEIPENVTGIFDTAFSTCRMLDKIKAKRVTPPTRSGSSIFKSLPVSGTLYVPVGSNYTSWIGTESSGNSKLPSGWVIEEYDNNRLTITSNEPGVSVALCRFSASNDIEIEYSKNGSRWSAYTIGDVITLANTGDYVKFRGDNEHFSDADGSYRFEITGSVTLSGNIMSLVDKTMLSKTISDPYMFKSLFNGCTGITSISGLTLPATTLSDNCYYGMFNGCAFADASALKLPALTLTEGCYRGMFQKNANLTASPDISATTLTTDSLRAMFSQCTSLSSIKVHFTEWVDGASGGWVSGVPSTGTFYCPAELPDERGINRIPEGWTKVDI